MQILNTDIMSHPLNWVTLFLMVFIAGIAIHFVLSYFSSSQVIASATNSLQGGSPLGGVH